MEVNMFTNQAAPFVHKVHAENGAITLSRCPQCGVLVAAGTVEKYVAIAEAVHKCRMMNAPRLTPQDLRRLS
jgi:ribosomal protein L32